MTDIDLAWSYLNDDCRLHRRRHHRARRRAVGFLVSSARVRPAIEKYAAKLVQKHIAEPVREIIPGPERHRYRRDPAEFRKAILQASVFSEANALRRKCSVSLGGDDNQRREPALA